MPVIQRDANEDELYRLRLANRCDLAADGLFAVGGFAVLAGLFGLIPWNRIWSSSGRPYEFLAGYPHLSPWLVGGGLLLLGIACYLIWLRNRLTVRK